MTMRNPFTKTGYQRLLNEWERLSKVERPKVVKGVADAAFEGDRSENAEYIYGKKKLREIDKRLQYLSKLLQNAEIVDITQLSGDVICFGSTVVVQDEKGETKRWTIVGEGETEQQPGLISFRSPMAKALLGKQVGDTVEVELPRGMAEFTIVQLVFGDRAGV